MAQVIPEKEILIQYVDGLHCGTGLWAFERQGDKTRLCYKIDLEPQGWLPRFAVELSLNFAGMHSRGMERLFDGLEGWLQGPLPVCSVGQPAFCQMLTPQSGELPASWSSFAIKPWPNGPSTGMAPKHSIQCVREVPTWKPQH